MGKLITSTLTLLLCSASVAQGVLWNPWASEAILPESGMVLDQKYSDLLKADVLIGGAKQSYSEINYEWLLSCRHLEMKLERIKEYEYWMERLEGQMLKQNSSAQLNELKERADGYRSLLKTLRATLPSELFRPIARFQLSWKLDGALNEGDLSSSSVLLFRYGHAEVAPTEKLVSVLIGETSLEVKGNELLLASPVSMSDLCFEHEAQVIVAKNCNVWSEESVEQCSDSTIFHFESDYGDFPWKKPVHKKSLKDDYGLGGAR